MSPAIFNPVSVVPSLPEDEPRYEIVDGVLAKKPPMGLYASILASLVATSINKYALPIRLGMAVSDTEYQREATNSRRPDVSYFEIAKFPSLEVLSQDPPVIECEPNLAVEVVSSSNTIAEMDKRIAHFFKTGVQLVWVVHPQSKKVCVYQSTKDCKILEIGDTLDGGKVLPGFSLPLADMFSVASLFL